ncbi:MAG: thioredoxin family protein [Candidatus Absconditabacteria bacterium]|nr:thioredoxin family protein [Candidatus Absconditabacteria bacterium]
MIIKILGTGCPKCKLLEQSIRNVVKNNQINTEIIKIQNMEEIMQYDIMALPGIVINEKVVMTGKLPDEKELLSLLTINK